MARDITRATNDYLFSAITAVIGAPFVISVRAKIASDPTLDDYCIFQIQDSSGTQDYWRINAGPSGEAGEFAFVVRDGAAAVAKAVSTVVPIIGQWYNIVVIERSPTDRVCYVDGGNSGTNNTDRSPNNIDSMAIGRELDSSPDDSWDGALAEIAIWDLSVWPGATAAAQSAEFERRALSALAQGYAPSFFRLGLLAYWQLVRDGDRDHANRYDMTAFNSPGIAAHPPMIYPSVSGIENWPQENTQALAGMATSTGTVVKKTSKPLAGTLTSAGALDAAGRFVQSLAGSVTSSGILTTAATFRATLTGVATSSGTLIKKTLKTLAGTASSSGTLATVANVATLLISSFVRAVLSGWFLPVPAYDTFTRANGALGNTELVGPDGQRISALAWNNRIGTTLVAGNAASASVLAGGIAIATLAGALADVWMIAPLVRAGGDVGVVVRYTDVNNYVIAYHDGTNVHLDKHVGGATTSVLNVVSAYAAGRVIKLVCEGTAFRLYYNDLLIGTDTIADAGVQSGVEYGLYSTNTGNSQADITILPRGSGEYRKLDTWGKNNL